jgi:sugar lactone lactonase YvrE
MKPALPFSCIPTVSRISTALACAILSLTGLQQAAAQSLRFAPPIFNVSAANGTTVAANLLNSPSGLAADAAGNLYIADTKNSLVRKVLPTQTATIFAGSGFGYSGDNGPAVRASMMQPSAVAVDQAGNVYISDPGTYSVRRVDTAGVITNFAGGNGSGSSGDGGPATAARLVPAGLATDTLGNLYIVDTFSNSVRVVGTGNVIYTYAGGGLVSGDASNGGPAISAQLNSPTSLATDSAGNLYIGDSVASTVRMVDRSGVIHPFAGTNLISGSAGDGGPALNATLFFPNGIALDSAGNVYITGNNTVRVVNKAGVISTMAGSGGAGLVLDGIPADKAPISLPQALAADALGNLFLAVPSSNQVYRVNLHPEIFPETRVGTSSLPQRLILENYGASTIHFSSIVFSGDFHLWNSVLAQSAPCTNAGFLFAGSSGWCTLDVVFTPTAEGIRAFPLTVTSNDTVTTLAETLSSSALASALSMSSGQMFIVAGTYPNTGASGPAATGPAKSIALTTPSGIVVDSSGNIFFSEGSYCQVERVDGLTGLLTIYGGNNSIPCLSNDGHTVISGDGGPANLAYLPAAGPLALDSKNNLYISDSFDARIRMIDTNGKVSTFAGLGVGVDFATACGYTADGGMASQALLCDPESMAFDAAGNLYFVETGNSLVRKISTAGILTTVAGTYNGHSTGGYSGDGGPATLARLNQPQGVVVNSAGDIFIADTNNSVVRKVSPATGIISTIAGQPGVANYSGDGGPAINSTLSYPKGLSIDAAGNVFVADYQNWVIRRIDTAGIITTVAGNNLSEGFNGDGLPATESTLSFPNFIFVSPGGHLFISDQDHELIREHRQFAAALRPAGCNRHLG